MPFQVGKKTNGEYKIVNMAFSGYGPHQMLALLQADRVRQTADCSISHFIYLCIPEHVERVGGVAFWDKHGPRFTLASNGAVVRDGNFDSVAGETGAFALKSMGRHLHDTFLMAQLISRSMRRSEQDLALMTAVICEAARLSREQQPKSEFHVILWDGAETERVVEIERELRASGIPVHRITEAISDFRTNSRDYVLNKYDLHPNPRQHEMIANYIVSHILQKDQRSGDSERSSH
jgi:hypothetical protein